MSDEEQIVTISDTEAIHSVVEESVTSVVVEMPLEASEQAVVVVSDEMPVLVDDSEPMVVTLSDGAGGANFTGLTPGQVVFVGAGGEPAGSDALTYDDAITRLYLAGGPDTTFTVYSAALLAPYPRGRAVSLQAFDSGLVRLVFQGGTADSIGRYDLSTGGSPAGGYPGPKNFYIRYFDIDEGITAHYPLFISGGTLVGIGTITPAAELHVVGDLRLQNTDPVGGRAWAFEIPGVGESANGTLLLVDRTSNVRRALFLADGSVSLGPGIGNDLYGNHFNLNGTTGNLALGYPTAIAQLHVVSWADAPVVPDAAFGAHSGTVRITRSNQNTGWLMLEKISTAPFTNHAWNFSVTDEGLFSIGEVNVAGHRLVIGAGTGYVGIGTGGSVPPTELLHLGTGNMLLAGGYIAGVEQSAPTAPAANGYRIFAQDNGAGKTQLMVLFSSGAAQQLAIQP